MPTSPDRRRFLAALGALPLLSLHGMISNEAQAATLKMGEAEAFDIEILRTRARQRATTPYRPAKLEHEALLQDIDFDAHQKIRFRPDHALWGNEEAAFSAQAFHLHRYQKHPVKLYELREGQAREILFDTELFDFLDPKMKARVPEDLGFAGFRLMNPDGRTDWLAYQGASYFRSCGEQNQYGQSARGVAVNTAMPDPALPEEFPLFTAFWLEKPEPGSTTVTLYALLEGESLTGAYRFTWHKPRQGPVKADVDAWLYPRKDIARLGIAPLTSMYWYGENDRRDASDWRPEVHDTDGLALWTGSGERIWRPLGNPPRLMVNSFADRNPRGFGLLQRDKNFDHYQDDGVFYEKRPSVWVEPMGEWGAGAVQLVEISTDDEIYDNIVAYWVPANPVQPPQELHFAYRLHWGAEEPYPAGNVAQVTSTRLGKGGIPGQPRPPGHTKFAIDFAGGPLAAMPPRYDLEVVVTASRGTVSGQYAVRVVGTDRWRAFFDLDATPGPDPVDLRLFLRLNGQPLTETWLYQYFPGSQPWRS